MKNLLIHREPRLTHVTLIVAALLAPTVLSGVGADTATTSTWGMPEALADVGVASDGSHVFAFGGAMKNNTFTASITEFDPVNGTNTTLSTTLPAPMADIVAVYANGSIYLFGGRFSSNVSDANESDSILRFDPSSSALTTMNATLSHRMDRMGVAYRGGVFDLIGGEYVNSTGRLVSSDEIDHYNPLNDTVTTGTTLPGYIARMAVAYAQGKDYIVGGIGSLTSPTQAGAAGALWSYDPSTETATLVDYTSTQPVFSAGSFYDGSNVFVIGGWKPSGGPFGGSVSDILKLNLTTLTWTTMSQTLPNSLMNEGAVWFGNQSYLFGGEDSDGNVYHGVVHYTLEPGVPTGLSATPTLLGKVTLGWSNPNSNTYSAPLGLHAIYKTIGGSTSEIDVGNPAQSYIDTCTSGQVITYTVRVANVEAWSSNSTSASATCP